MCLAENHINALPGVDPNGEFPLDGVLYAIQLPRGFVHHDGAAS